jgi:hypothetical protein
MTVQADIPGIASRGGQCRVAGQCIAGRQSGRAGETRKAGVKAVQSRQKAGQSSASWQSGQGRAEQEVRQCRAEESGRQAGLSGREALRQAGSAGQGDIQCSAGRQGRAGSSEEAGRQAVWAKQAGTETGRIR